MIEVGKMQTLKIMNFSSVGAHLDGGTGFSEDNILLPNNQINKEMEEGQEIEVFIYRDSEDRIIATKKIPLVQKDQLGYLEAVDITNIGAFFNWGLEKDILMPFSEQRFYLEKGKKYLVKAYEDKSGRLCVTTKIEDTLEECNIYEKDVWVEGIVYKIIEEIGVFVAVDNKYFGLIPPNEFFEPFKEGEIVKARIIRVREDGKLDLSPREKKQFQMDTDSKIIYDALESSGGFLPFHDKSSSESVKEKFNLSKKAFKRALGKLYKEKKIDINENGISKV